MFEQVLNQAGLGKDEVRVYELLLKEGELAAHSVITGAQLKRGTAYNVLRSLKKKGLLDEFEKHNKAYFRLEPPSRLRDYVESQKRQVEESAGMLEGVLPQLVSQYSLVLGKPGVKFYEGVEGLKQVYEAILAERKPIDSIEDKGDMVGYLGGYTKEYIKKRVRYKLANRSIAPATNQINATDPLLLRESHLVPLERFPFRMDVKIAGNKVSLVTFQKQNAVGVLIENVEIADNFRALFNFLWELTKITNSEPAR